LEWKFVVTIESLVRRPSALVFLLTLASTVATVRAAENPRKSPWFGLFGDEKEFFSARPSVERKSSPIGLGVTL
jgi:hypothetical protein